MSRFIVHRVILINALGYPYEIFEYIDGTMMQLQGDNGAGKTTAMVCAIAPLMPDIEELDDAFSAHNQQESGVEGRVAINGNPTYAILELRRAAETIYIGVQFHGTTGKIKVRPFVVKGLSWQINPANWLFGTDDKGLLIVSMLDTIRDNVGRLGGSLKAYDGTSSYFRDLHESGLLPKALETGQERKMYWATFRIAFGASAHEILGRLRDYMLPPDTTLVETVRTMDEMFGTMVTARNKISDFEARQQIVLDFWVKARTAIEHAVAHHVLAHHEAGQEFGVHWAKVEEARRNSRRYRREYDQSSEELTRQEQLRDELNMRANDLSEKAGVEIARLEARAMRVAGMASIFEKLDKIEEHVGHRILTREQLEEAGKICSKDRKKAAERLSELCQQFKALKIELDALEGGGSHADAEAVDATARDLGGTAVFRHPLADDLDVESAALLEAKLGPAAHYGVVVENRARAIENAGGLMKLPDNIYLLGESELRIDGFRRLADDLVVVSAGSVDRITRIPEKPILGKQAREIRIRELRTLRGQNTNEQHTQNKLEQKLGFFERDVSSIAGSEYLDEVFRMADEPDKEKAKKQYEVARSTFDKIKKNAAVTWSDKELQGLPILDILNEFVDVRLKAEDAQRQAKKAGGAQTTAGRRLEDASESRKKGLHSCWMARRLRKARKDVLARYRAIAAADQHFTFLSPDDRENNIRCRALVARFGNEGQDSRSVLMKARDAASAVVTAIRSDDLLFEMANELQIRLEGRDRGPDEVGNASQLWTDCKRITLRFLPQDRQTQDPAEVALLLQQTAARAREEYQRAESIYRNQADEIVRHVNRQIDIQKRMIHRLSERFGDGGFGNFEAIRLTVTKNQTMLDNLIALMQKTNEASLFDRDISFSDALEKAVKAIEKERNTSLGTMMKDLTDYRQYCDVQIEVRRRNERGFGPLKGASNGERIGLTFFSLFMLMNSWEERNIDTDGRPRTSSVRLLVLDEATQVDKRGIGVLHGFAERTDSRIILAAPQEAPVPGQTCVYSLVRRQEESGDRVEVTIVSRARIIGHDAA